MQIRYKTRKGQVIKVDYDDLKAGEHWVTTNEERSKDGATHHFVINENGEITRGFGGKFNGMKPSEISKPSISNAPIGTIASCKTLIWKKTKEGWDLYQAGELIPKDTWEQLQGEKGIRYSMKNKDFHIEYPSDKKAKAKSIQDMFKSQATNTNDVKTYMDSLPIDTRIEFTKEDKGNIWQVHFTKTKDGWLDDYNSKENNDTIAVFIKDQLQSPKTTSVREINKKTQDVEWGKQQYPNSIAGVAQGKPMTREQANNKSVNPHYDGISAAQDGYCTNCQSCVVAFEARLRGYDVQVQPNNKRHPQLEQLANKWESAWLNKNGKVEVPIKDREITTAKKCEEWLENSIGHSGERYVIAFEWKGRGNGAHIVSLDRDGKGNLRLYCPQSGKQYQGKDLSHYLGRLKYTKTIHGTKFNTPPQLLRIDDKAFNPKWMNDVMTKAGTPYEGYWTI